jgi:uncharacterized protein (DUF488 family)
MMRTEYGCVAGPKLFTIGYERRTPQELVDELTDAGVERVVDVRELPLSRRRGFSKRPLSDALASAGIVYEHVRELGNPKEHRELYKSGRLEEGRAGYRAHLGNGSRLALLELAESIGSIRTCLLCVEEHTEMCHRGEIVAALHEQLPRLAVAHL